MADYILRPGGPNISPEARLIYLALFSYMGADGTCYPSLSTLAQGTALDRRTVIRRLAELEASGLLRKTPKRGKSNHYLLCPPWNQCPTVTSVPQSPVTERHHTSDRESLPPVSDSHPKIPMLKNPSNTPIGKDIVSPASSRQTPSFPSSSGEKKSVESADTKVLVETLDKLLQENGLPAVADWAAARKIAGNALQGTKGGAPIPVNEATETLTWAFRDSYWRQRLVSGGMPVLRAAWAAWRERGQVKLSPAMAGLQRAMEKAQRQEKEGYRGPLATMDENFPRSKWEDPPASPKPFNELDSLSLKIGGKS